MGVNQRPTSDRRLFAGYPDRMLIIMLPARMIFQTGWFLLPPLLPATIEGLQITKATTGIVLALSQSVYTITQYPGNEHPGRWTRTTLVVPGLSILVLGFLIFGLAGGLTGFVAAATITGLGKRLFTIPSRALLFDLFVERRGRVFGPYVVGTDLGGLISSGLAIPALTYMTWRAPFPPAAVVPTELAVFYTLWSRGDYTMGSLKLHVSGTPRRLFANARQRQTLFAFELSYFIVSGFANFFPIYLIETKGLDQQLASVTLAIVFAIDITIEPVAGGLGDRFRRESITIVGVFAAAGALIVLLAVETRPLIYVSVVMLATGYRIEFPLVDTIIIDNVPDTDRGVGLRTARTLSLGTSVLGSTYAGIVATYASYVATFAGPAVCLVVSAGSLYRGVREQ